MTVTAGVNGDFWLNVEPDREKESVEKNRKLESLFYTVFTMLGGQKIRVELNDTDWNVCFNQALSVFRALSSRSVYEAHGFLKMKPNVQTYVVHEAIDNVVQVYRKRAIFGMGAGFDYFAQVSANLVYPGYGPGGYMGIASYDLSMQYEETLARLFAREPQFSFRPENHTITFLSTQFGVDEIVVLRCYVLKTISELLADHWAELWLRKYTAAFAKTILGQMRSKFGNAPGAQGGLQLNGERMLEQGEKEIEALEKEIEDMKDGSAPAYPILA